MSIVLDTEPLLTFYLGKPGDTKVEALLNQVKDGSLEAYINIVNLTEFYYILYRYSPEAAEEKTRNIRSFGVNVIPVTDNHLWRVAAETKSRHPMSLADAYAVATAVTTDSKLVIGADTEFDGLELPLIRIR